MYRSKGNYVHILSVSGQIRAKLPGRTKRTKAHAKVRAVDSKVAG